MVKIAASILSCDFACLSAEIMRAEAGGADLLHIDVMDGHFVPNITIGAPVIKCIRGVSKLPFDVHLMVEHPHLYIDDFAQAGADIITIHVESDSDIADTLIKIKKLGLGTGISLNPDTPHELLLPYLEYADMVLVMTVRPGFGGQAFIPAVLDKISAIKKEITSRSLDTLISVDGGINLDTAPLAIKAGTDILVSGSYIFESGDVMGAIGGLRGKTP